MANPHTAPPGGPGQARRHERRRREVPAVRRVRWHQRVSRRMPGGPRLGSEAHARRPSALQPRRGSPWQTVGRGWRLRPPAAGRSSPTTSKTPPGWGPWPLRAGVHPCKAPGRVAQSPCAARLGASWSWSARSNRLHPNLARALAERAEDAGARSGPSRLISRSARGYPLSQPSRSRTKRPVAHARAAGPERPRLRAPAGQRVAIAPPGPAAT
jgi:hypothetical protein